jgi:hypothetical protein
VPLQVQRACSTASGQSADLQGFGIDLKDDWCGFADNHCVHCTTASDAPVPLHIPWLGTNGYDATVDEPSDPAHVSACHHIHVSCCLLLIDCDLFATVKCGLANTCIDCGVCMYLSLCSGMPVLLLCSVLDDYR